MLSYNFCVAISSLVLRTHIWFSSRHLILYTTNVSFAKGFRFFDNQQCESTHTVANFVHNELYKVCVWDSFYNRCLSPWSKSCQIYGAPLWQYNDKVSSYIFSWNDISAIVTCSYLWTCFIKRSKIQEEWILQNCNLELITVYKMVRDHVMLSPSRVHAQFMLGWQHYGRVWYYFNMDVPR